MMPGASGAAIVCSVPEGLSATEVGKELSEHREQAAEHERQRIVAIIEALLLSIVALLAAWAGYSAAKWGTHSSLSLAEASRARANASVATVQATQIRTLDLVTFNTVATAYVSGDRKAFQLAVRRLRPAYRPAFDAWLATHPLKNPNAPADPSDMPQYRVPQEAQAAAYNAEATQHFSEGESAAATEDKYVRLTVLLAAVLFLVGIGSRFPIPVARYGLVVVAGVLLVISVVQLLGLPGPPS